MPQLPVGWTRGVMSALALGEDAEGMKGLTSAAISLDTYGGTGYTRARMKAELPLPGPGQQAAERFAA